MGSVLSDTFTVTNGVRQGGILSPILFNVYMDELSVSLKSTKVGCNINGTFINHLFYADDSVIMAPSKESLQRLLDVCDEFALQVELKYNTKKTFCMCLKPKWLKDLHINAVKLNDIVLDFIDEHCYLGVKLTCNMSDNADLKRQVKANYSRGNGIIKIFIYCTDVVKVKLFNSYCTSFYGSVLWVNYNVNDMRKVRSSYNKIFRSLMKISDVHDTSKCMVNFNVDNCDTLLRKLMFSFRKRLYKSDNNLIDIVISSVHFYTSAIFKLWSTKLYIL